MVASEVKKRKKKQIHKVYQLKKIEKKKKLKEYIPEHGREEKELRREEKEMDIDVFYIWERRRKEPCLL
jgi:hypothetical protein